jgi:hypothetical protein
VSGRPEDAHARARELAARDLEIEGVEMVLALEDLRRSYAPAAAGAPGDGRLIARRVRAVADALYPDPATRDDEALARVLEVVATDDLELPR